MRIPLIIQTGLSNTLCHIHYCYFQSH